MKLKELTRNKTVLWTLLVIAIAIVTLAGLRLFYRGPEAPPRQDYSPEKAAGIVSDYLVKAEYVSVKPPFEAYSDVRYSLDGDKWMGRYNGPSAWGENSTIVWVLYEDGDAVQIVVGYAGE